MARNRQLANLPDAITTDTSNNVGIGVTPFTNTLSKSLDLVGGGGLFGLGNELYLTANIYYNSNWYYKATSGAAVISMNASGTGAINFSTAASGTINTVVPLSTKMVLTGAGLLTIGNTSPASAATRLSVYSSTDTAFSSSLYCLNSSGSNAFFVRGDGVINTGTLSGSPYNNTSANAANLYVSSGGTLERATASSQRFKENINDWNASGLDTILALKPKTFTYKADYYKNPELEMLGLIAEEVAEVSPYLAEYENEDRTGQVENVRYATIVVPLIKAVQELKAEIEELKALIAAK